MPRALPGKDRGQSTARGRLLLATAVGAVAGAAWWGLDGGGGSAPVADGVVAGRPGVESPGPAVPAPAAAVQESGRGGPIGSRVVLVRVELAPSGAIAAVLSTDSSPPRRHLLGDSLGPDMRLARIDLDSVTIERGGRPERVLLPAGMEPARKERLVARPAQRLSATLPRPATPEVAQVLDSVPGPAIVTPSPDRPNPARSGVDRMVAAEALRLSTP